jgi:membrane associated rhomboid family serine protease
VGLAGFLIGGKGGGILGADLGLAWGASVGFGFGWIFDQKQPSKWAVAVWAVALALIGTFIGLIAGAVPDCTLARQVGAGIFGAAVGALFGLVIGMLRERKLRQRVTADL